MCLNDPYISGALTIAFINYSQISAVTETDKLHRDQEISIVTVKSSHPIEEILPNLYGSNKSLCPHQQAQFRKLLQQYHNLLLGFYEDH